MLYYKLIADLKAGKAGKDKANLKAAVTALHELIEDKKIARQQRDSAIDCIKQLRDMLEFYIDELEKANPMTELHYGRSVLQYADTVLHVADTVLKSEGDTNNTVG